MKIKAIVIDALARAEGKRYSTFDVVGAGPRIIAGLLTQLNINTDLRTYEHVMKDPFMLENYDVILISAMITDYKAVKKLLKTCSKKCYYTILGGPISLDFYKILNEEYIPDLVIVGEGEEPLLKLFTKYYREVILEKDYTLIFDTKGYAFKHKDTIVFTGFPDYISKDLLNSIKPYTRIDKSYENPWYMRFYVEVVRGCSNFHRPLISISDRRQCIKCLQCYSTDLTKRLICPQNIYPGCGFCSIPFVFGPPRSRSVNSIVSEIKELIRHGARRIVLSAPDFLDYGREYLVKNEILTDPCSPEPNIKAISYLLSEIYEIPEVYSKEVIVFVENVKACLVNSSVAQILGTYLKGTTIHIGLETCNDDYNRNVLGKPITRQTVYNAVSLLKKAGLRPYVYLMYNLPFVTSKVYRDTIKCIPELYAKGVEKITLYKFIPLPFTLFEEHTTSETHNHDLVEIIDKTIDKYNMLRKKELVNKVIEAFIILSNKTIYGYPSLHGPVIIVNKSGFKEFDKILKKYSTCRALIKITNAGRRVVYGDVVSIKKCYKKL